MNMNNLIKERCNFFNDKPKNFMYGNTQKN